MNKNKKSTINLILTALLQLIVLISLVITTIAMAVYKIVIIIFLILFAAKIFGFTTMTWFTVMLPLIIIACFAVLHIIMLGLAYLIGD